MQQRDENREGTGDVHEHLDDVNCQMTASAPPRTV